MPFHQIPICAQECQNGGVCVAPDTCKCQQWPNVFIDSRSNGGRPLFQDSTGEALPTGWTGERVNKSTYMYDCGMGEHGMDFLLAHVGHMPRDTRPRLHDQCCGHLPGYDCSVPICVQAETFLVNVPKTSQLFVELGGHGGDGQTTCLSSTTGELLPRCPQYDYRVTGQGWVGFGLPLSRCVNNCGDVGR